MSLISRSGPAARPLKCRARSDLVRKKRAVQNTVAMSAKTTNRESTKKKAVTRVNALARRPRGRPRIARQAESDAGVLLRADNYRRALSPGWNVLGPGLAQAKDAGDVGEGVKKVREVWLAAGFSDGSDGFPYLSVLAPRVFQTVRDRKWPKRPDHQITFLADALSGFHLAPRAAHELCEREREKQERWEARRAGNEICQAIPVFDVECSCGYRGHSVEGACPTCGAQVSPWS